MRWKSLPIWTLTWWGNFIVKISLIAVSAGRFGITDGVEIFLPLLKLASKLLLFSSFIKVAGTEIQDQIMSVKKLFFICTMEALAVSLEKATSSLQELPQEGTCAFHFVFHHSQLPRDCTGLKHCSSFVLHWLQTFPFLIHKKLPISIGIYTALWFECWAFFVKESRWVSMQLVHKTRKGVVV